jgi:hypothetical protein
MIIQLGLNHESINCYPSGCVLYEEFVNRDLDRCPNCGLAWYMEHSNNVPIKVLWYFPIISRLQRLYKCLEVAKLMKWHAQNQSQDMHMRSIVDGEQYAAVGEIDPSFVTKPNNVYMGLVADGINPYGNQSTKYSMWPTPL